MLFNSLSASSYTYTLGGNIMDWSFSYCCHLRCCSQNCTKACHLVEICRKFNVSLKEKDWHRVDSQIPSAMAQRMRSTGLGLSFCINLIYLIFFNAQNHSKDISFLAKHKKKPSHWSSSASWGFCFYCSCLEWAHSPKENLSTPPPFRVVTWALLRFPHTVSPRIAF